MKKMTLLCALFFFIKGHAQFEEFQYNYFPETLTIDQWSGTNWEEFATQTATFNSDCFVETTTTLISGLNYSRSIYTYNSANQITEIITEINNLGTWVNSSRRQNAYIGNNLTEEIESVWDGSSWVNSFRTQNIYTGTNLTEEIESIWDGANWVLFSRSQNNYNGSNQLQDILYQVRDAANTSWENNSRTLFSYNTAGLLEQEVYEEWNVINSTWDSLELTTYAYTGSNVTEITSYFWDGSEYLAEERSLITYIEEGLFAQVTIQEYNGSNWDNIAKLTFTYPDCLSLSIEQPETFDVSFYPNPSDNSLKFLNLPQGYSGLKYTIFDMTGRLVQKGEINTDFTISTQFMTNGLYLLKLSDASNSVTKQFVVKH